jgi:hypothetical protein
MPAADTVPRVGQPDRERTKREITDDIQQECGKNGTRHGAAGLQLFAVPLGNGVRRQADNTTRWRDAETYKLDGDRLRVEQIGAYMRKMRIGGERQNQLLHTFEYHPKRAFADLLSNAIMDPDDVGRS